jgi:hypothetical protein
MKARARFAMLITLLVVGGIGADWWMEDGTAAAAQNSRLDGPDMPPPTPSPMP